MDKAEQIKVIDEMQRIAEEMRRLDIEENPEGAYEMFECSCCGKTKPYAGSIQYGQHRFCNECTVIAEAGLALKKIKSADELIAAMEEKRLEELCSYIKQEEKRGKN